MIPTFSIFKPGSESELVDTLKHCFIERRVLDSADLPANIVAKDGLVYQTIYDSRVPQGEFEAIISFQRHTYGKFAIIRVAKEEQCSRK